MYLAQWGEAMAKRPRFQNPKAPRPGQSWIAPAPEPEQLALDADRNDRDGEDR
jgi:hypothetical protein